MKEILELLPFELSAALGVVIVVLLVRRKLKRGKKKVRPPVRDPLLCPPGFTLSEQLSEHSDTFLDPILVIGLGAGVSGATAWHLIVWMHKLAGDTTLRSAIAADGIGALARVLGFLEAVALMVLVGAAGAVIMAQGTTQLLEWFRKKHRLHYGLRGEQAVAEQLQSLVRRGYYLFNDVPTEGSGNLDHALVGPAGVFAIETKARAKWQNCDLAGEAKARFDGNQVCFSDGRNPEVKPVRQAEALTRWLEKFLSKSTGRPVPVRGVIALHGWFVEPNQFPTVIARNPGYLAKELADAPRVLSPVDVERIAFQLEQRCRNVEF